MRRPVVRILGLLVLYFFVFVILVNLQFSKNKSFTLSLDGMLVRGSYLPDPPTVDEASGGQYLTGGVKVSFAGLEFNLSGDGEKGLFLILTDDTTMPSDPITMTVTEDSVQFVLEGGTELSFSSFNAGSELRINTAFSEDTKSLVIPVNPRRASPSKDNERPGFIFGGAQYYFTPSGGLQEGRLVLSGNSSISYRIVPKDKDFKLADFVVAQAHSQQAYNDAITQWRDSSYGYWSQNASTIRDDDTASAYLGEAVQRGRLDSAIYTIPQDFRSQHGYQPSVFLAGTSRAYRDLGSASQARLDKLTRQINGGSLEFLNDEHTIDFLQVRGQTPLIGSVLETIRKINTESITAEYCPGLLEAYVDFRFWRLSGDNPVELLINQICLVISHNLKYDSEKDLASAVPDDAIDLEYDLRLGKSLLQWAESSEDPEWAAVGRSLVLSVLARSGSADYAKFYRILDPATYYPRAKWLMAGGLWIWTASPTASAVVLTGDIYNISVSFPAGMTQYLIIRGVRPFLKLQLHDIDFRSASDFERWDSSGWIYYQSDQTLIVKLKHRTNAENIKIYYRVETPSPPVNTAPEGDGTSDNT